MANRTTTIALLLTANLLAAFFAPLQDCDEVFNYWEPAHYLLHGYGMQTWEFSPEYSIRSWLYIMIHAVPMKLFALFRGGTSKTTQFLFMRILFAIVNTITQTRLYDHVETYISRPTAWYFMIISATSAGNFISASSFLPNSFVMYGMTMATAEFIETASNDSVANCLTWLAAATILGWPFVGLLSLPFAAWSACQSLVVQRDYRFVQLLKGLGRALIILAAEIVVDSYFAGHLHSVPFNITFYNVFPKEGQGPDIYGTEPWYFYILNLTLNFNLAFFLALIAMPLTLINPRAVRAPLAIFYTLLSPFYLWLGAMSLPAHKEERFMYPIYPCLALNAVVSLHILGDLLLKRTQPKGKRQSRKLVAMIDNASSAIPLQLRQLAFTVLITSSSLLGIWRSAGLATAYNAPLKIYSQLPQERAQDTNVCVGKEWYRFPSSFYLPSSRILKNGTKTGTARLKFVRSSFHGLLPGEFANAGYDLRTGSFPATSVIPQGMNDRNQEDTSKYTDISQCDFLVDSRLPSWTPNEEEPDYISSARKGKDWRIAACEPFLDAASTGFLGRVGWAPRSMRTWGEYCLLEKI